MQRSLMRLMMAMRAGNPRLQARVAMTERSMRSQT